MNMKNILILDDNNDILKALQLGLCACLKDCNVLTALNGEKGGEILKDTAVDLIVTDLDMPVSNGFRFIEKTRRDHPSVPVYVMAGNCLPSVRERLNALGVRRVIAKPFPFENLAAMITEELKLDKMSSIPGEAGNA